MLTFKPFLLHSFFLCYHGLQHKILPESACPDSLGGASKAQECRTAVLRPLLSISPGCDYDDGQDDPNVVIESESLRSTLIATYNGSHLTVTVLLSGKDMKDNRLLVGSNNQKLKVSTGDQEISSRSQ